MNKAKNIMRFILFLLVLFLVSSSYCFGSASFQFFPAQPKPGETITAYVTDSSPYVYVHLKAYGPNSISGSYQSVTYNGNHTWTWKYKLSKPWAGDYTVVFTKDNYRVEVGRTTLTVEDASFYVAYNPIRPQENQSFTAYVTASTPYAYVHLIALGNTTYYGTYQSVSRNDNTWTWRYHFNGLPRGKYPIKFTADSGSVLVGKTVKRISGVPSEKFVQPDGAGFIYRGESYRFIGVNISELAYLPEKMKGRSLEQGINEMKNQMQTANDMGAKVIRVFMARCDHDSSGVIKKLERLLNKANEVDPELKFIISLTNFFGPGLSFSYVQNDDVYYEEFKLKPGWFTNTLGKNGNEGNEGYKTNYRGFVTDLVDHFHNYPQIFAWELGNELAVSDGNGQAILEFAYDMGWNIKNRCSQMVTTGFASVMQSTAGTKPTEAFYINASLDGKHKASPFDFITVHYYDDEFNDIGRKNDYKFANNNSKPYIIEEAGFTGARISETKVCKPFIGIWKDRNIEIDCTHDRSPAISKIMDEFFDHLGCEGFMPWAFMAPNIDLGDGENIDLGTGDGCRGMDNLFHQDWCGLLDSYSDKANDLDGICKPPTCLAADSITSTSAHVFWNSVTGATSYWIAYKPSADVSGWESKEVSTTFDKLDNLTPATKYVFVVSAFCPGYGWTPYSSNAYFTTKKTTGTLKGYVYAYGRSLMTGLLGYAPVKAAIVTAAGRSDITDSYGYYSIPNIPAGTHFATCKLPYSRDEKSSWVTITSGGSTYKNWYFDYFPTAVM